MSLPKILTFNLNVGNVILCDKYYQNMTNQLIPEEGVLFKRKACYNPLFIDDLERIITENQPEVVVITTEENVGGYFHSDFLPDFMPTIYYEELSSYQYKSVNMSIYIRIDQVSYYQVVDSDKGVENNIDLLVQYLKTPLGYLAFIGLNKINSPAKITYEGMQKTTNSILNRYVNYSNAFASIIMGYIDRYDDNYMYYGKNAEPSKYTLTEIMNEEIQKSFGNNDYNGRVNIFTFETTTPKILCFSWNTDKTPLCDEYHGMNKGKRTRFFQDTSCYSPEFFKQIYDTKNINSKVQEEQPEIVVINTEGDVENGTFFHYEFLKTHMHKYTLLDNEKITGIGDKEALRMSIYVRNDVAEQMNIINLNKGLFRNNNVSSCSAKINKQVGNKAPFVFENKSKALVKFVETKYGIIAFMGLQFPHDFDSERKNECLSKFTDDLLNNKQISYIFIMGDFATNSPDNDINDTTLTIPKILSNYKEGMINTLRPNYKLAKIGVSQRQNYIIDDAENYQDVIGWHDRIFHKTVGDMITNELKCIYYDNVFGYPMLDDSTNSQHLGIMGVYELKQIQMETIPIRKKGLNKQDIINELREEEIKQEEFENKQFIEEELRRNEKERKKLITRLNKSLKKDINAMKEERRMIDMERQNRKEI